MKRWILLVVILAGLFALNHYLGLKTDTGGGHQHSDECNHEEDSAQTPVPTGAGARATMQPGRVVELKTNKGLISFILLEKDCPKTTARIVSLVESGAYKEVSFARAEDWIIQTDTAKKDVPGIGLEIREGLTNAKGTVGMIHKGQDYESNTSVIYILKEPQPSLDGEYTIFGRVIKGMEVVLGITSRDYIVSANVRPLNNADLTAYEKVLRIEAERKTQ